jgi:hypothetical protein
MDARCTSPRIFTQPCAISGMRKQVIKIWADAICINQADTDVRSQQVQQMGTVYSVARSTIIYLGESSPETDSLFTFLGSVCTGSQALLSVKHEISKPTIPRLRYWSTQYKLISWNEHGSLEFGFFKNSCFPMTRGSNVARRGSDGQICTSSSSWRLA